MLVALLVGLVCGQVAYGPSPSAMSAAYYSNQAPAYGPSPSAISAANYANPQPVAPAYGPSPSAISAANYANQPATTPAAPTTPTSQCTRGACCSSTGLFLAAGEPCKATTNPCEEMARCTGNSAQCPENPKKPNGTPCMVNGKCTDGFCVVYECSGLCCANGKTAADETPCGKDGKCVKGTCTIYKKADPHIKQLDAEDKEVIKKAQKQVKGELEGLLRAHARYIKNKSRFEENAKSGFLEKLAKKIVGNTVSSEASLQSGNGGESFFEKNKGLIIFIVGACVLVAAVVIILIIKPKDRRSGGSKHKTPKRKTEKGENMASTDYEPPAF